MGTGPNSTDERRAEVVRQVRGLLHRSGSFGHLSPESQEQVVSDTAAIVETMAANAASDAPADPYMVGLAEPAVGEVIGGEAAKLLDNRQAEVGSTIGAGVTQAARMVNEIDFPQFVASLIQGTFQAIVDTSIQQMEAYAEMVKSVTASLNDFKDESTTDSEAAASLASRYPRHLQIQVVNNEQRLIPRDEMGFDDLPDFAADLGLDSPIDSLDEETIAQRLIPATRMQMARNRQQLLATTILMGINRIIVTDGKINAKIIFSFSAEESTQTDASAQDYANVGQTTVWTHDVDESGEKTVGRSRGRNWRHRYVKTGEDYQRTASSTYTSTPDVRVTAAVDTSTTGAIQAAGQIMGGVSINFKSETFPLEKMVSTDQMMRLQQAQGPAGEVAAGHGAAAAAAPAADTAG